ncbi:sulfatase-like hydrolase/transferase [Sphingobacterium humi]|uniref:Glycosyltransferase n=1 Tax=Sphingobacterium humi TaxID=1796905 RepID=A0A6N8L8E3_9SPHI|nr:sulfatase-like hydrolase/transferase [Sphingobacterium humi]MVZ64022.1 glycosyltransferase [Sphingobacterium humi]
MSEFVQLLSEIVIWLFLLYSAGIFSVYSWIAIFSYGAVTRYKQGNVFTDYSMIAKNPNAPGFSLIAPAYNEGKTIVENVRSLLSIYYHKLEIIIVNDGSKDDSMERLIEAYDLEKVSYFIAGNLMTKEVINVYKSSNPAFRKLIVVDKKNGGKADALNVGVNISKNEYIVCIDVDCIIEQDAILKLAKPFMEQTDKRLVACGGVIRLANNCKIENGKVTAVNLPKSWLGRSQALEYIRAFVLGRMAWSRASGLILISGAFGAFDKEIVLACGGYDHNTVGEDMELVVRMRRYMIEQDLPHRVINIPDPLCWTEVPEDKEVLKKQRNRWMRGTMETLWTHRKLMFNPKYGKLGMVSLPYWFFFEFLGPFVELCGYITFWIFVFLGIINWTFFIALYALVLLSSLLYSVYGILVDLVSRQVYSKRKDLTKLMVTAMLEPFYFHPLVVWAGVRGMIDFFLKKNGWGEMTRQGFSQEKDLPFAEQCKLFASFLLAHMGKMAITFMSFVSIISILEWFWYGKQFAKLKSSEALLVILSNNLLFASVLLLIITFLFALLSILGRSLSRNLIAALLALFLVGQAVLALYFSESKNLLGADLFYYSREELKTILAASGMLSIGNIALLFVAILLFYYPIAHSSQKLKTGVYVGLTVFILGIVSLGFLSLSGELRSAKQDDFLETAERSKLHFFLRSNVEDLIEQNDLSIFSSGADKSLVFANPDYPFLKDEQTADFLGPYLQKAEQAPNLVFLIIEGLGNAYSANSGYIGNFTPFLESLKDSSLVWENNLSSSGRTFSVLPTMLGSLPFGAKGFLEQETYPKHFNLINILGKNGFKTGFFYGGDASFDFMAKYLQAQGIDQLVDQGDYDDSYRKLPAGSGGSWGYEDQAVFAKMTKEPVAAQPYFHIGLTLSTHNPFLINDAALYERKFTKRLQELKLPAAAQAAALENKKQLTSVINLDEALKGFFENYKKRADFKHTIFIITGDHSMPEIPLESKIDRFHVPLLIYSPLLKEKKRFSKTVSHFDVAPSVLSYYKHNYNLQLPAQATWVGEGLSVGVGRPGFGIPMMQSKNQLIDFVFMDIHINAGKGYKLMGPLQEDPVDGTAAATALRNFERYQKANKQFIEEKRLVPDSLYHQYFNEAK